jgi:hypothetical protein
MQAQTQTKQASYHLSHRRIAEESLDVPCVFFAHPRCEVFACDGVLYGLQPHLQADEQPFSTTVRYCTAASS